jgi:outer membrane protein assembly factor BamB
MSGEGPAIDESGNVYVATGNGTYNGTTDFSDSVLKMKLQGGQLRLLDWFTPTDQVELKDDDYDLGSGGVALVPNSHLAIAGGKEGRLYLLDRNNLGKGASVSLQSFQVTHEPVPSHLLGYNIHGTAVIWPRDSEMYVYVMGEEDPLKQFRLVPDAAGAGWRFDPGAPFKVSTESAPYPDFPTGVFSPTRGRPVWMPGGFLELSANGTKDGTGILWVNMPFDDNANRQVVRGILRAFDASDVSKGEIWDSESTGRDNDRLGQFAKYCPPVVANGKVYVATFQQETILVTGAHIKAAVGDQPALVIYGPLASIPVPPSP